MIEEVVLNFLDEKLSAPVYMEERETNEEFVMISKADSSNENYVTTSMFVVMSYAGSLLAAAKLNETVKKAMSELHTLPQISACRLATDYNFTDTASKRYRYQAVFNITHY